MQEPKERTAIQAQERARGHSPIPFDLTRLANRTLDRILGLSTQEVLNPGPAEEPQEEPDVALQRVANEMRSAAMDPQGHWVDYEELAASEAYGRFRRLTHTLPKCELANLEGRSRRMALWINLYNALLLDAIVQYQVSGSLSRHLSLFRRAAYDVGGLRFSADDIEHGILRGNRRHPFLPFRPFGPQDPRREHAIESPDPRVHFTLVCGARSCPPIAFYRAEDLDRQLDLAAGAFINGDGLHYDPDHHRLWLSRILRWYQADFGGLEGVLCLVKAYLRDEEACRAIERGGVEVRYMEYNWSVNAHP
jgi:hypothetical protein